ncbi:major facilitator superfamily domain-containing protein [Cercophora newfieldiana]|uniref:Major facilitator superfamily domain-containing protein n=1 Tax=Cercophora newfieldiana TaxID=92897 RepID=A0AA39YTU8_9PEZI|nr:major facilitator superfamily domain-containing protein [Cercophora newfieldiana]
MAETTIPASNTLERVETSSKKRTLGHVQLRDHETNEIILIPTPSNDPNDPLNWSQPYKHYIAAVICIAMMMCNFLAAGPSIAIVKTTMDFFPGVNPGRTPALFGDAIAKISYFFTTAALMQGVGNFFWVPIANKYGRRPTYIFSYLIYTISAIWLCFDKTYSGFLAGRIIMGFGAGAAETIAPITIADVFFLHERGTVMALYTSFLAMGASLGVIISGLITINHTWRVIYQVASPLIGFVLLLAFFTFPETAYIRDTPTPITKPTLRPASADDVEAVPSSTPEKTSSSETTTTASRPASPPATVAPKKKTYLQSLRIFHKPLTNESLFKLVLRPLGLICLPPVLWAALVQSVTIGFLVAISSNIDLAFHNTYGFESWQVGLCFVSAIVGSFIGIPAGGHLADIIADWFTRRNGGVRDPEMRLPTMLPSLITMPLSLILYGVGIEKGLHWICPTIGLGLLSFSIVQATNVCLVYVIDAYRPVAGEITLAVMGFKSLFGFLLSFYTNTWVEKSGYMNAFGAMAGISALVIVMAGPLFLWGKRIRQATWGWKVISYIHWSDDREVGE